MLGAGVVLRAPDGRRQPLAPMRELAAGTDRYGAEVTVTSTGLWQFQVEAWGDPIARWQHDAAIKIPLGQDVERMLGDGAALFERAAAEASASPRPAPGAPAAGRPRPRGTAREALEALAARLRDPSIGRWTAWPPRPRRHHRDPGRLPAARPADLLAAVPGHRAPAARALRLVV